MPRSRDIEDYFEARLLDLKPGETLEFDIHLFFPQNRHIMLWRSKGEMLTDGFLDKYQQRGVDKVWIHREDTEAFYRYMNPAMFLLQQAEAEAASGEAQPEAPAPTELAEDIKTALAAPGLNQEERAEQVGNLAQEMLRQAAEPVTQRSQSAKNQQLRQAVKEIIDTVMDSLLDETRERARAHIQEIWKLADIDPDLEHAVNVSTFAVIFAMAFGRIDAGLLADLAYAGLLHDIGLTQVPSQVASKAWKSFAAAELREYSEHVAAGISLIEELAPDASPRVKLLISQHHEKFDGTGYPRRLDGFKVDDVAQLLAISDTLDSFASGQWDGVRRTLKDTFDMLEKLEKTRTFPEYFNPEVFAAVIRWIRSTEATAARAGALAVVEKQTRQILKTAA